MQYNCFFFLQDEQEARRKDMESVETEEVRTLIDFDQAVSIVVSLVLLLLLIQALRYLSNLGLFEGLSIEETCVTKLVIARVGVETGDDEEGGMKPCVSALMAEVGTIAGRLGVTDETGTDVDDRNILYQETSVGRRGQLHGAWDWDKLCAKKKGLVAESYHGVVLEHGERVKEEVCEAWKRRLSRWPTINVKLTKDTKALLIRLPEREGLAQRVLTWRVLRRFRAYVRKRSKNDERNRRPAYVLNEDGESVNESDGDDDRDMLWLFLSPRRRTTMFALCLSDRHASLRSRERRSVTTSLNSDETKRSQESRQSITNDSLRRRPTQGTGQSVKKSGEKGASE